MSLLELQSVGRRFGALQALSNISLNVDQGELRAIIGPNGAGKTTLFNLISGFFPPTEGAIIFDGSPITAVNPASLVRRGIIRTFQITEIFLSLTVAENLRAAVETAMGLNLRRGFRGPRGRASKRVSLSSWISSKSAAKRTGSPVNYPTVISVWLKSASLSRAHPSCSCSMSPPPAWVMKKPIT